MYIMYGGCYGVGVIAARNIIQGIIHYHWPGKDAQAMSSIEVKKADIPMGTCIVVSWKDKPVFLWHRSPKQIADAEADDHVEMRDPQTDSERVKGIAFIPLSKQSHFLTHSFPMLYALLLLLRRQRMVRFDGSVHALGMYSYFRRG